MRWVIVFLVLAIAAIAVSVVSGALAMRAKKGSSTRKKFTRIAIVAAVLTGITVVVGAYSMRTEDLFDYDFVNDMLDPIRGDTFLGSLT